MLIGEFLTPRSEVDAKRMAEVPLRLQAPRKQTSINRIDTIASDAFAMMNVLLLIFPPDSITSRLGGRVFMIANGNYYALPRPAVLKQH